MKPREAALINIVARYFEKAFWLIVILTLITLDLKFVATASNSLPQHSCHKKREILSDSWGIITDGENNYMESSHCEWLITANSSFEYIHLKFTKVDTECAFDFVHVFDGDSYNSTLLGSFSGTTLPQPQIAKSGKMLVMLFSDVDYALKGFEAEYSITECPFNCSQHGECNNGTCTCEHLWTGEACEILLCPDDCGYSQNRGTCEPFPGPPRCKCNPGFTGYSCSLGSNDTSGNVWHVVAPEGTGLPARMGHAGAYLPFWDRFYVHGGFTLNAIIGDFYMYDMDVNKWEAVLPNEGEERGDFFLCDSALQWGPCPRYGHAVAAYGDGIALYGGVLANGSFSSELWFYSATANVWSVQAAKSILRPPPLARHTLTVVDEYQLYLFGGNFENGTFSSLMFRINLKEGEHAQWERVRPLGGLETNRRLAGHSAVFHAESRSIVVYGGLFVSMARVSKLSDQIHMFNVDNRYWSRVYFGTARSSPHVPIERAFHSANIIGSYMVVFGGYSHDHAHEERCYDNRLFLYHLGCHTWLKLEAFHDDFPGTAFPVPQGLYSHVTGVRGGNTLLIAGGFSGSVRSHFLSYTVPFTIAPPSSFPRSSQSLCSNHKFRESCRANPDCGWCHVPDGNSSCLNRWNVMNCEQFLERSACPGICPHLRDCQSCLAHGEWLQHISGTSSANRNSRSCSWRVQHRICHSHDDTRDINSTSTIVGWWGRNFTEVTTIEECRIKDLPPGITLLKYYHPPNWNVPDEVSIVNSTSQSLTLYPQYTSTREQGGSFITRFYGFLHPVCNLQSKNISHLKMCLKLTKARGILRISTNDSPQNLEVVANFSTMYTSGPPSSCEAKRPKNRPLFPNASISDRYLMDFKVHDIEFGNHSAVDLTWNGCPDYAKHLTIEFLEPYSNGSCLSYTNCLQCLSDSLCGWCETSSSCIHRLSTTEAAANSICVDGSHTRYLVTNSEDCVACSSNVYCQDCAKNPQCEWLVPETYCVRRGRFNGTVRNVSLCPTPCHELADCKTCLSSDNHCAWCEGEQKCFAFNTYSPSFHHGICNRWIEQEQFPMSLDELCHTCDHHRTCKDCLKTFGCGWCFSDHNPLLGVCASGDFHGPSLGSCRTFVSTTYNLSEAEPTDWTYGICPDVEECTMGLHNCHADATCTNTFDSYICTCNRGFRGDGNETCSQTCYENCVHGHCSEAHNFSCICDLGWTGSDCSINCECNNHSMCTAGVGHCDECHNWTHGKYCENCRPGSFGNATSKLGCQKCDCNGHGDPSKGFCDVATGVCYCRDSTEGDNCETCQDGYFGNPRNGSQCYRKCDARVLMTDVKSGGLGAQPGGILGETCLWILTVHSKLEPTNFQSESLSTSIVLTIEPNLKVRCADNYVYIYDGLPYFIASNVRANPEIGALGAFCSMGTKQAFVVEARSGLMTVFYQRDDPNQGFNATYEIRQCPDRCKANRTCINGECKCEKGFVGRDCDIELCPNNCSFSSQRSGQCNYDLGRCECDKKHGGPDCSHIISPKEILLTSLVENLRFNAPSADVLSTLPRMGHTMIADHRETLWVFGGWSITRGVLGDVLEFDTRSGTWLETTVKIQPLGTNSQPLGRYFHAATYVTARRMMYVYGGFTNAGEHKVLGDFWSFNIISRTWSLAATTSRTPPPLAGHTLTNRADSSLILIGGFDMQYGFSEKVYEYNLAAGQWNALNVTGGFPVGIYGHTTVYHAPSESFYVYGGVLYKVNKTMVSSELYAFHYPSRKWTVLPLHDEVNPRMRNKDLPSSRYLHTAVVSSEYMLVMGGQSESGNLVPFVHAYVFDCNMWVDILADGTTVIGDKFSPAIGLASAAVDSSFYVFGGFTGTSVGNLMKLDVPSDLCSVYHTREACQRKLGCSFCSVFRPDGFNSTYCYTNKYEVPPSCHSSKGTSEFSHGTVCSKDWIERRNCYRHTTCSECLASWPIHPAAKNVCQWCSYCGRCIRIGSSCEDEKNCSSKHPPGIKEVAQCPERQCSASDCEKCKDVGSCIWTRQVLRSSDLWRTATNKPNNNWNCFNKAVSTAFNFTVVSMPPKACPPRCTQLKDCKTCLSSDGAEGGWHECRWSESLKECVSPSYQYLRCAGGVCGRVQGHCPRPCVEFTQCSHCLSQPHCGWCALNHTSLNGWGKCMEGGLEGPSIGICKPNNVTLAIESVAANVSLWMNHTEGIPTWAYLSCPPENECLNNHHTCDKKSELCVDTLDGFECRCREGYVLESKRCKPVCHKGCVNGTCTEPNVCICHFGYVGENCSIHCQCNGHSNCKGVDQLDVCLECQNNTQGKQCEKCKALFVGDPQHNGQCIPCKVYCNGHSDICLSSTDRANNNISGISNILDDHRLGELLQNVTEGPGMEAICMNCLHFTKGDRCEDCIKGYFRTTGSPQDSCRPCECNGHSDTCDAVNGEGCKCENNTSSDTQCSQKGKGNSQPCWKLQCSKCNEYFMGNPTNGHQCYRQMFVDRDYCFDPKKQNTDCNTPTPLYQGRTVFFAIHPRYMNVDIRVIVDVTKGGVDFFFSPKDDTFVVDVNKSSGIHDVSIDDKYGIELSEGVRMAFSDGVVHQSKWRRSIDTFKRVSEFDSPEISVNVTRPSHFKVRETFANGLKKFVTITDPNDFLVVRNLHNRLVITLPQAVHDLRNTRFYIVLHGIGDETSSESFGTVFFRQDQPRIDLFVFFSVFFSCFFLFLAVCVVIWKVKQAVDLRRARQRHAVEMEHMASRPFAKMLVIIEEDPEDVDFFAYSPSYIAKKPKSGIKHSHGRDSPKFLTGGDDKYCVRPVAVEPTDDNVAAVNTLFFQLPGGDSAPVRLSLGSSLVLMRVYPNTYSSIKACMRRRVSHHSQ